MLLAAQILSIVLWVCTVAAVVHIARLSSRRRTRREREALLRAAAERHWRAICTALLGQGALTTLLLSDTKLDICLLIAAFTVAEAATVIRFAGVQPFPTFRRRCSDG